MKILLFSDAHGDSSTAGMRRIDDISRGFQRVTSIALEREVDIVSYLGDLADPDCGSIIVRVLDQMFLMATTLSDNHITFFLIAGNHDTIEDGSGISTLHPLDRISNVFVYERPGGMTIGDYEFAFLPYPTRVTHYDPAKVLPTLFDAEKQRGRKRIVLGHCTDVRGARAGSESGDLARGGSLSFPIDQCKELEVDLMGNGHFHHQQVTEDGVHIPGSLECIRFDEEQNTPGIFIVTI